MSFELTTGPLIPLETRHVVLPPNDRIYAISDVHGFFAVMKASLDVISRDLDENPLRRKQDVRLLMLGDVNDKGPDTKKCVDLFSDYGAILEKSGGRAISLFGNHEKYMIDFLNGPRDGNTDEWINKSINWIDSGGGFRTFKSYGVAGKELDHFWNIKSRVAQTREEVCGSDLIAALQSPLGRLLGLRKELAERIYEAEHMTFYRSLQTTISAQHFVFCHAQILPDKPVEQHTISDVIFGRNILKYEGAFLNGSVVVYGHSDGRIGKKGQASDAPRLKPNSIGIDPRAIHNGKPFVMSLDKGGVVRFLFDGNREVGPMTYKHEPADKTGHFVAKAAVRPDINNMPAWKEVLRTLSAQYQT